MKEFDDTDSLDETEYTQQDNVGSVEDFDEQKYTDLVEQYKDADNQYQNIKNDIDMSTSIEEQRYWEKRSNEVHNERDELGFEIERMIQQRNNK